MKFQLLSFIFCSRNANNLVNKNQKQSLRLIANDKISTFEHLLRANNVIARHQRNLKVLIVEFCKMINGFTPRIMEYFFLFHENIHNISNFQIISDESKTTVRCTLETVKYRAPLPWENLPEKYNTTTSLNSI